MAEYIDREKLYNNLILLAKHQTGERQQGILGAAETVRLFSAADVAPVRRGHWIEENGCQICSECGEEHEWDEYRATYCDVCGAKMEVIK